MADDFEIIPEKEISNLKKEIQKVKENPFGDNESSGRFYKTIDNLNDSMSNMLNLFKIAADGMQNEEKEEVFLAEKIKPLSEKIDKLLEQNEKIAKALVAIADMVDEIKTQKKANPLDDLRGPMPAPQPMPPQYPSFSQKPQQFTGNPMPPPPSFGMSQGMPDMKPSFGPQSMPPQMPPEGSPSPFLDDDPTLNPGAGLPSFSDFSDKKMNMPPPPKDDFPSQFSARPNIPGAGFSGMPPSQQPPARRGLFGKK